MTKTPIPENIRDMLGKFSKWKPTSLESLREACHRMLTACNDTLSMPKDSRFVSRLPGRIYVSNNGITLDYYLALSAEGDTLRCLRLGKKNRIGERELTRVSLHPTGLIEKGFTVDGLHGVPVKYSVLTERTAIDGIMHVAREYAENLLKDVDAFGYKQVKRTTRKNSVEEGSRGEASRRRPRGHSQG